MSENPRTSWRPSGTPLRRPAEMDTSIDVSGLVAMEQGLLDRAVFTDEQLYAQELRRVFAPSWLFLCHESQLKKPGDFFTTYMGADPVIVSRAKDKTIKAFLNSCRHRGARVCRADFGSTKAFTCSYHGWAYGLDGALVNVPYSDRYGEDFDRDQWGLVSVPQVEVYKGLVFGTWNPEAPPLTEALGDIRWYLDAFIDRDPEGTEVVGGVHKWVLKGNWKLAAEQFATDWYHVNMSHASALMVMSPTGRGPSTEVANRPGRQLVDREHGHGAGFPTHPRNRFDSPTVHDFYGDYSQLRDRLGDARVEGPMLNGHATIFPNFSYLPINGSIRVWHPVSVDEMEVWTWTVLDSSMSQEAKDSQRLYNLRTFGPSGIFEQDDGENWSEVQAISSGFVTNRVPLNYQMTMTEPAADGLHPGNTSELFSDAAGRAFYARWAELMNTPAWFENRTTQP